VIFYHEELEELEGVIFFFMFFMIFMVNLEVFTKPSALDS